MRLRRAERAAVRTQESEESPRYPLKPFQLKFEKIHPTPHPFSLLSSHSHSQLEDNSRLTDPSQLRTPEEKSQDYESDFESYASILQSESAPIQESVGEEQNNQDPPNAAVPQSGRQSQLQAASETWLRRMNQWLVRRVKWLREGVRELAGNRAVLRAQEGELLRLRSARSHALDLAYHSRIHRQAELQVQRAKSTSHSLHAHRNLQHLSRYRAVRDADLNADSPPRSPQLKLASTREQLLTVRRLEERYAAKLRELAEKEERYGQLVDSCEGALSRVSAGGLEGRKQQLLRQIAERQRFFMQREMETTVANTALHLQIAAVEAQIASLRQTPLNDHSNSLSPNNPETPVKAKAQWLKMHFRRKKQQGRYSEFARAAPPCSS